jgi:hypothetical protein
MKVLLLLALFASVSSAGQGVTKTAEGESTIVMKGASIGLDLTKTQLTFGLNNFQQTIGDNFEFLYGGSIKAENKEGVANLFSQGDFVPAASLDLLTGFSFSNGISREYEEALDVIAKRKSKLEEEFPKSLRLRITNDINQTKLPQDVKDKFIKELETVIDIKSVQAYKAKLVSDNTLHQKDLKEITENIDNIIKKYTAENELLTKATADAVKVLAPKGYYQIMLFGYGGIQGSEFKRFTAFDTISLSNSFIDESYRGGRFGAGLNAQYGILRFGINYGYYKTSNFALLTKKNYIWERTETQGSQTVKEKKEISAYTGTYGEVEVNELNYDLIINIGLGAKNKSHLLINPYIRSQLMSRNAALLPNSTNVGCGFYFFKDSGKFLGGFYAELPDINNNYEKIKPEVDQGLRAPLERMTFGIVAKLSLNTLIR